ncbi:MAG: carboxypeptidase regulatory-like domain-containing protein [Fibrobacter sp.]|nr:carboxypeptidase regulatory-like domain-containing protein [Fibrobacter sp.]
MMQFRVLNIAGIFALTAFFSACSDDNHAGVLTETESGTTVASIEGLVKNTKGSPVVSAKVSLISSDHIAARMAPIKTATTDKSGKYTIENVSAGDYALQISNTEHTQSGYQTITVEDNKTDTQTLKSETTLEKNASLKLKIDSSFVKGDTLCITGTLNCIAVSEKDVKAGAVTINEIPPSEFTKITFIKGASSKTSTQNVKLDFVPGGTLEASSNQVSVTVSSEAMESAKKLNGKKKLDSMIVPVTLNTSLKNPVLLNDEGDTLVLYKLENDKNSDRYLTVIPNIDVGTYNFTIASSNAAQQSKQILKAYGETEPGMTITQNDYWKAFGDNLGISFWITKSNSFAPDDTIFVDTRGTESDVAFSIKLGQQPDLLCTEFLKRDSLSADYKTPYFSLIDSSCHKVLDGERHHYSLFIRDNHIVIAIDGNVADSKDFRLSFQTISPFSIGNHKLEDFIIFSLNDSIMQISNSGWERLYAWLSTFYKMQK